MTIINLISTEKPVKKLSDTIVPNVDNSIAETFDTLQDLRSTTIYSVFSGAYSDFLHYK